ncbi:MAG: hypothetical protein NXH82_00030 [Rhodobacteraceae bacterium]|nr:hypothetical protein [Paracoccaceae bacterium]
MMNAARVMTLFACAFGAAANAQTQSEELSGQDYLFNLQALAAQLEAPASSARASTIGIPGGYTLPHRSGYVAVAGSDKRERSTRSSTDGSLAFGIGMGDPVNAVGMDVAVSINSAGASDFADSGSVNFKVSRQIASPFQGEVASVALGLGNAVRWGDTKKAEQNYYVAASSTLSFQTSAGNVVPTVWSLGYGSAVGTFETSPGLFAGFGVGVTDWLSLGASWSGDEVIAGATIFKDLFQESTLQIEISYGDVGHQNSDGRWMINFVLFDADIF